MVQRPDQDGGHEPAVLADLVHVLVAGAGEDDVLVDALELVGVAGATEEVLVDLGLPRPEPRTGSRAGGAAPLTVTAVVRTELFLQVKGLVLALGVVVAQDVVRAGDHAARAPRAEAGRHDFVEEVLPMQLLRRHDETLGVAR